MNRKGYIASHYGCLAPLRGKLRCILDAVWELPAWEEAHAVSSSGCPMLFGKNFTGPEYIPRLVTAQMEPCQY
jgi:hypothetical protein